MGDQGKKLKYDGLELMLVLEDHRFKLVTYTIKGEQYVMGRGIKVGQSLEAVLSSLPIKVELPNGFVDTDALILR